MNSTGMADDFTDYIIWDGTIMSLWEISDWLKLRDPNAVIVQQPTLSSPTTPCQIYVQDEYYTLKVYTQILYHLALDRFSFYEIAPEPKIPVISKTQNDMCL